MTDTPLNAQMISGETQSLNTAEPSANRSAALDPAYKNSKHFLNADEAAELLRMDSRTLVRWARLGQVPAHPLGEGKRRLWRFIEAELISWLALRVTPFKKPVANTIDIAINAHARRTA